MKQEVIHDPTVYKAAGTSIAGAGISIAAVNEILTLVAITVSIFAGCIAIYRGISDIREKRQKDEEEG